MRTKTQEEFLSLIRYEIAGTPLPEEFAVSDESALLKLSELQDLTHLIYDALQKNNIPCKNPIFMSQYFAALWRVEQMDYELGRMSELFEENGMNICGISPNGVLVEAVEIPKNDFFVGVQYHPEFKSRPNHAHPLFREFIRAAGKYKNSSEEK